MMNKTAEIGMATLNAHVESRHGPRAQLHLTQHGNQTPQRCPVESGTHTDVAATAGSAEKCRFLFELGCERALNYKQEDWDADVVEWSGGKGVDVILDMVGGDYFAKHLKLLGKDGRLVHIATMRGSEVNLDLRTIMAKRLMIAGSTLRPRSVAEKRRLRDGVEEHSWPMVREGKIRPIVDHIFSLVDVARAHERMESSLHIGKIVLKVA